MQTFPEWTDVRYFLEVARTGKLSLAAERMGVEHSTVSRRIDRLEQQLKSVLFDRTRNGYSLTDAGRSLVPYAEAMENAMLSAIEQTAMHANDVVGTVRIGTPEAFGVMVLAQRLPQLAAQFPLLHVELMAQPQFPSLVTREVEVLVTLDPPQVGRYRVTRLAENNYYLYASPNYLAGRAPIRKLADLSNCDFIDYVHDGSVSERFRYLEEVTSNPRRIFTCTSVLAQREAAVAGLGLVLLPPYGAVSEKRLINIFPGEPQVKRTLWLAAPEDLFRLKRVRVLWDFLRQLVENEPCLFRSGSAG